MMTRELARLLDVDDSPPGSALVEPVAETDEVLVVADAGEFAEDGGKVVLNETVLDYVSADLDEGVIVLAGPAGITAEAEVDYVAVADNEGVPATEPVALVALDNADPDDEPLIAEIDYALVPYLTDGLRSGDEAEIVEVDVSDEGYVRVVNIVRERLRMRGSYVDPVGLPAPEPAEAPAVSPAIRLAPHSLGFVVIAEDVAPTSTIAYHVSDVDVFAPDASTLLEETRSQVVDFRALPDGTPFAAGTSYYFRAVASNVAGEAPPTDPVEGQLRLIDDGQVDSISAASITSGELVAALALLGSLQVGQMTLDPDNGFTIPLSDGGMIRLPADGSDAVVTAILRARSLIVEDNLRIQGQVNAIEGGLVLADGISAPTIPPRVGTTWAHADAFTDTEVAQFFGPAFGLFDNGPHWLVNEAFFGGSVWMVQKATGVRYLLKTLPSGFIPTGGTVSVGSSYYVLGDDSNRAGRWFVYVYDSTWTKTGEWEFDYDGSNAKHPVLATDGTDLYIGRMNQIGGTNNNRIRIRRFTTAGVQVGENVDVPVPHPRVNATGMWVGSADFGPAKYAVFTTPTRVYVVNLNTGNRVESLEWARAAGDDIRGIGWDGTRFHTLGATGKVWHYSANVTAATRSVTHTWFDNQSPEHETQASPAKVWTQPPRQWMTVETDPPAYAGGPDDPNAIRVYIDDKRQPDLATMQTEVVYDVPSTDGPAAPTSNGFDSVGAAPGKLASDASDASGPLIVFKGDGSGRAGPLTWDATGNAPDTGDLNASASGFSGSFRAVRLGQVAFIVGSCTNSALTGFTWTDTGVVLPPEFRPASTVEFPVSSTWTSFSGWGYRILSDGNLQVRRGATSNAAMPLNSPYFPA